MVEDEDNCHSFPWPANTLHNKFHNMVLIGFLTFFKQFNGASLILFGLAVEPGLIKQSS